LRFDRPAEAATLLAALARISEDPSWALRTRCLALLRAGRPADALSEATLLIDSPMPDAVRAPLLLVMAQANWRLGNAAGARARFVEYRRIAAAGMLPPPGGRARKPA
jgi:hypothetical protein